MILDQRGRRDHERCLWREAVKEVDQSCGFIGIALDFKVPTLDQTFGLRLVQASVGRPIIAPIQRPNAICAISATIAFGGLPKKKP